MSQGTGSSNLQKPRTMIESFQLKIGLYSEKIIIVRQIMDCYLNIPLYVLIAHIHITNCMHVYIYIHVAIWNNKPNLDSSKNVQ